MFLFCILHTCTLLIMAVKGMLFFLRKSLTAYRLERGTRMSTGRSVEKPWVQKSSWIICNKNGWCSSENWNMSADIKRSYPRFHILFQLLQSMNVVFRFGMDSENLVSIKKENKKSIHNKQETRLAYSNKSIKKKYLNSPIKELLAVNCSKERKYH